MNVFAKIRSGQNTKNYFHVFYFNYKKAFEVLRKTKYAAFVKLKSINPVSKIITILIRKMNTLSSPKGTRVKLERVMERTIECLIQNRLYVDS